MHNRQFCLSFLIITCFLININSSLLAQQQPTPSDLVSYHNPRQVALSPNGKSVIVHTRKADINNNQYEQSIWLLSTESQKEKKKLQLPSDAKSVEWLPGGDQIAYLARAEQRPQVWVKEIGSDTAKKITEEPAGIQQFSIAPDGESIAYTTVDMQAMAKKRKQAKARKPGGVEVDLLTFSAHKINNLQQNSAPPSIQAFISDWDGSNKTLISNSFSVKDFEWSPDANNVALAVVESPMQSTGIPTRASSLGIYNRASDTLEIVAEGKQNPQRLFEDVISHSIPFWSPSGDKLGFLRTDYSDRWETVGEIGIYDLKKRETQIVTSAEKQEFYKPIFHWVEDNNIFIEHTREARRGLYKMDIEDSEVLSVKVSDSYQSRFTFSANGQALGWVQQSVDQPPEVYFANRNFDEIEQLSTLNKDINNLQLPRAKSITWQSDDNTEVQGWYIYPDEKTQTPPVITLIHGGPPMAISNKFHPYLQQWPFPIQSITAKGYAVFIPNYRHSASFGKKFKTPTKVDQEPIEDILTGIDYLIDNQLADEDRLGITGHSHGGWLGPMVAAEKPIFKAASFAEGFGNYLSLYSHMDGARNKGLHEYYINSTPYQDLERYIELSPAFKDSLTTQIPTLLEFGQRSPVAKQGVELAKAFWRHNTPHKLTFYPDEGHSIQSPSLQVDAMKRNMEWFDKWIPAD